MKPELIFSKLEKLGPNDFNDEFPQKKSANQHDSLSSTLSPEMITPSSLQETS